MTAEGPAAPPAVNQSFTVRHITDLASFTEPAGQEVAAQWHRLVDVDQTSQFNQTPEWCLAWYGAYRERFAPIVITAWRLGKLCGLVPLASERTTGRLTFAGDNFCDYRDVLAVDDAAREVVAGAMVAALASASHDGDFTVGPTHAASTTVAVIEGLSRLHGVWPLSGREPRFVLRLDGETVEAIASKKHTRRSISQWSREGEVRLDVVNNPDEWALVRDVVYDHHSLRQLHAGRPRSFNDPAKRAFYDALVTADATKMHVSILRVGKRILAEHCGYIWRGHLTMGLPAFDTLEEKRSPGNVLLAKLFQQAFSAGLDGIDFTPGPDWYKQRLANASDQLPVVRLNKSFVAHAFGRGRNYIVEPVREFVNRLPVALLDRLRPQSWAAGDDDLKAPRLASGPDERVSSISVFRCGDAAISTPAAMDVVTNDLSPLLDLSASERELGALVTFLSRSAALGDDIHIVVRDAQVIGWARARNVDKPLEFVETGPVTQFHHGDSVIYGVSVLPQSVGSLADVLSALVAARRHSGKSAGLWLLLSQQYSERAIGFELLNLAGKLDAPSG